jgi:HemX protein
MESGRELLAAAAIVYGGSFLVALLPVLRNRRHNRPLLMTGLGIGLALQTWGLYERGLEAGGCPLGNPFELIQFVCWSAVVLYFVVGPAFRMSLLGFFSSGLAAVACALAMLSPGLDTPYDSGYFGGNPWIETHAALAVFSYGVFGVLALTSLMHLIQNYGLKEKRGKGLFIFLPSILDLNQMGFRLVVAGLVVLTLSLLPGVVYWVDSPDRVTTVKLVSTILIWGAYWVLLLARRFFSLPSVRFSICAILLFLFALLSLMPVDASRVRMEASGEVQP